MGKIVYSIQVLVQFADKYNLEHLFKPGETLITDEVDRVNFVVAHGLGELKSAELSTDESEKVSIDGADYDTKQVKDALNAIGVKIAVNAGYNKVSEKVSNLTEDQVKSLTIKLTE